VYVCRPVTVDDAAVVVGDVGSICAAEGSAREFVNRIEEGRKSLNEFAMGRERISFIYLVWWDPSMVVGAGTYISSLLEEGPFSNVFADIEKYPEISPETINERMADVIFLPTEPYEFTDEITREIEKIADDVRMIRVDGRMCGWYGSRTAKGIVYVADLYSRLIRTEC
jgi:iron complex transport system substrate-binding protein